MTNTVLSVWIESTRRASEERATLLRLAAKPRAGDFSGINFTDIPELTEEQLSRLVRLRDVRRKVPVSVRLHRGLWIG